MGILHYRIIEQVALGEVVQRLEGLFGEPPEPTWLLAQSPAAYQIGTVDGGLLRTAEGEVATSAYSLRLFCPHWEARWSRRPESSAGPLVVISEASGTGPPPFGSTSAALPPVTEQQLGYLGVLDGGYLLWGKVLPHETVTSRRVLAEHRIGSLALPPSADRRRLPAAGSRLRLRSREYLAAVDSGNVAAIEERLLGIGMNDE